MERQKPKYEKLLIFSFFFITYFEFQLLSIDLYSLLRMKSFFILHFTLSMNKKNKN